MYFLVDVLSTSIKVEYKPDTTNLFLFQILDLTICLSFKLICNKLSSY